MTTFSVGQIIVPNLDHPKGQKDFSPTGRLYGWKDVTLLVLEAKSLNKLEGVSKSVWRGTAWALTVMKLDGSSTIITTYFDSDVWSTVTT